MTQTAPLRLRWFPLSGHSHRAQLGAALLGVPVELVAVDLKNGEHKQPAFMAKNAFGQVPMLEQGDFSLSDSNAILVYLAERYDEPHKYWPRAPELRAEVQRWLSVAAGQLVQGPCNARLVRVFGAPLDHELAVKKSHELFQVLEAELSKRAFLVGESATLADIAMYSYTAHAPEGDVSLEEYPALRAWLSRVEALPGFVAMVRTPNTAAKS